jgi:hypothetical protein
VQPALLACLDVNESQQDLCSLFPEASVPPPPPLIAVPHRCPAAPEHREEGQHMQPVLCGSSGSPSRRLVADNKRMERGEAGAVCPDSCHGPACGVEDVKEDVLVCICHHVMPLSALQNVLPLHILRHAAGIAQEYLQEVGGVFAADCALVLSF